MTNIYDRGQTVRCIATFVASGGVNFDPASVFFFIENPLGTIASYAWAASVVRAATGIFYADIVASTAGGGSVWSYRFEGYGGIGAALTTAGEGAFNVRLTPFA